MQRRIEYPFLILLSFLMIAFLVFNRGAGDVVKADETSTTKYLSGYAWSSNTGWISFRGSNYGVDLLTDNNNLLSGYAWSSNIGWISFDCGRDIGGGAQLCSADGFGQDTYPSGSGTGSWSARLESTDPPRLSGWARACSVFQSGCSGPLRDALDLGGWDGWISLDGDLYSITLGTGTVKPFSGFSWGGGSEMVDGQNLSPQSPGWISWRGSGYGVDLCDDPTCGAGMGFVCSHELYPRKETPIVWSVTPTRPGYTYHWTVVPPTGLVEPDDYEITSGQDSDQMTVVYHNPGTAPDNTWQTNVQVYDGGVPVAEGQCQESIREYVVGDEGFYIIPEPTTMNAQFVRGVNSVTYPDVTLSIDAYGGFDDDTIELRFVEIDNSSVPAPGGSIVKGLAGTAESHSDTALIVEPQFWMVLAGGETTPVGSTIVLHKTGTDGEGDGIYESSVFRLKLTKNQDSSDQRLPSRGDYQVVVNSMDGSSQAIIPLTLNNPSGGVIEK